jgi:Zn-dependent M28 family amino/carboxypeptidase
MLRAALFAAALAVPGAALAQYPAHPRTGAAITAADLAARDRAIADDAFAGRGPGTPAGEAAAAWIADDMRGIGLRPGNHGSWFQDVPAVSITLDAAHSSLAVQTARGAVAAPFGDAQVFWSPHFLTSDVTVTNAPLVFAGYGVVAPEYHWNDYAGVDVRGKTVVVLVNDPGNEDAHPDPAFFKGKAMTYYGRWTYKYEEAARQGAVAALIVHETGPAAYGWQVVRNSNAGARLWLDNPDGNARMPAIEGWITRATAEDLFRRAGLEYAAEKRAANQRGFTTIPLEGETLTATAHSKVSYITTKNVIGVLPGRTAPNEVVLYTAHWDHLGTKPGADGVPQIYNGAVDNGMGVASILEIAEAFAHRPELPRRSVAFVFWTLEEQGLLGSAYFADHPLWPLRDIVAGINIDALLPEGPAHDMVVIGNGASALEDILAAKLKPRGRVISADPEPEKGYFYRSDHISLAKVGVPMLYIEGGFDLVAGGKAAGMAARDAYRTQRYHQPSDKYDATWDLSGPVADLQTLYEVGETVADGQAWPEWYAGNEFRAIRDKVRP